MEFLRYIPAVIVIGLILIFIWKKWDFMKGVLSDGTPVTNNGEIVKDKDGNPIFLGSTTRVLAFYFGLVVGMCLIYTTVKTEKFDTTHLIIVVCAILILTGLLKAIDALGLIKGQNPKQND